MFGYIPSPGTNGISLGPLRLHMYGFLIVAGVFAAVWLADRRWRARGGEAGTFSAIALWAVPGGLVGARLYHVITDYELYTHHPLGAFEIWQGGLGIWGGIAGGTLVAWAYVRRHNLNFPAIMDAVAPALPLAQAIGRWGNYFNQELFGRPTTLPWGLKIAVANRPPAYVRFETFHPTFLYESLWDLVVVLLVLWIGKHVRLRKGYLFAVYVALYTFGRFFTEYMRIDFAHKILGLRINDWVSVIIFVGATMLVLVKGRVREGDAASVEVEAAAGAGDDDGVDDPELERARVGVAAALGGTVAGGDTLEEGSIGLGTSVESELELEPAPAPAPAPAPEELVLAEPEPEPEPEPVTGTLAGVEPEAVEPAVAPRPEAPVAVAVAVAEIPEAAAPVADPAAAETIHPTPEESPGP